MFEKYLDPKNGYVFKQLLGTEKKKDILLVFLNKVLKDQIRGPIQVVQCLSLIQHQKLSPKNRGRYFLLTAKGEYKKYK